MFNHINYSRLRFLTVLVAFFALQSASMAVTLSYAGSGIFMSSVPVTQFSRPDAQWSFFFNVDTPVTALAQTDMGFDVNFTDFSYMLDGVSIGITPLDVRLFPAEIGGMFDIDFVPGTDLDLDPVTGLAFTGPGLFSGSISAPVLLEGQFTATGGTFYIDPAPVQFLGGTVVNVTDPAQAPEPGSFLQMLAAAICFLAVSVTLRRLRVRGRIHP